MPRNPKSENTKTSKERQGRYRVRQLEREKEDKRKVYEHHCYRVRINVMLARRQHSPGQLADSSGVKEQSIESGLAENCGIFRPEEIQALYKAMPHVEPPLKRYW